MKRYCTIWCLAIVVFVLFLTVGCYEKQGKKDDVYMGGSTNVNLLNGGRVSQQNGNTFYCSPAKQSFFNAISNKSTIFDESKKIRTFVRSPRELCVANDLIFFKLTTGSVANSYLYCLNTSGKSLQTIINENVKQYMIFNDRIYYTLDDTSSGIFVCDMNGKNSKMITDMVVSEFVCYNNRIFYVVNNSILEYRIDNEQERVLIQFSDMTPLYLAAQNEVLFFICDTYTDEAEESHIYMMDMKTATAKEIYTGFATHLHIVEENVLIFRDENGYYLFDINNKTKQALLSEYEDLTELYVFGTDVYFYTTKYELESSQENLYYLDINSMQVEKIV